MLQNNRIRCCLTTTSSSTSRADIVCEQPVVRPLRRGLVVRALGVSFALTLLWACGGDATPATSESSEVAEVPTEAPVSTVEDAAVQPSAVQPSAVQPSAVGERDYDLQGHRGARGLRPENTLPGFELALDLMVDTLEFDLHLSADDVVMVWHDPWLDTSKCTGAPDGIALRDMTAQEQSGLRCDKNPDTDRFPDQVPQPGAISGDDFSIATLARVFQFVQDYADDPSKTDAQRANAAAVRFNIETKRKVDDPSAIGDGFDGVTMGVFESAVVSDVDAAGLRDRVTIQSFDHRSLWSIHAVHPDISLAALTRRNDIPDFAELAGNGAAIWSPDYRSVGPTSLANAHDAGLLVVPWTVNDADDMGDLLAMGVDGIITDFPDLIATTS